MKIIEKLKTILEEKGIDEETSKEILAELDEGEGEPKPEEESPAVPLEETPKATDESQEEPGAKEAEAPAIEVPPEAEAPTEPTEPALPIEEPAEEVPPAPIPEADPKKEQLRNDLDELKKANEGLLARVDSLEEALRRAGVIEGEKPTQVGYNKPSAPANDGEDVDLASFFAKANRKRF